MINNDLDLVCWHRQLREHGHVQVEHFLQPAAAERLRQCLQQEVPWTLALRDDEGARTLDHETYAAMDPAALQALLREVALSGRVEDASPAANFRFVYDSYMMVRAYREGRDPGLLLHRVLELFNSPDYIAFAQTLTGDTRIRRVDAQATRYQRGHFLRWHTDEDHDEGRLYAYVLNLSQHWRADWGGLLQFIEADDGRVSGTLLPRWNTLSLFAVPAGHAVSLVTPWAQQDRLAITGWFLL